MICKYQSPSAIEQCPIRFILTMWYVNEYVNDMYCKRYIGFILTMWYVNYGYDFPATVDEYVLY